jgi:hypothetical protein
MSNYTKTTNFTAKDSLTSGNPAKIVKGAEHDAEYNAIAVAVNSKSNTASPTFTGTVEIPALTLNSVLVTSTAAELNILDGVTATAAELNILDGVTATAAEINALDGITATVTELNYTDGVTSPIQAQIDLKAPITNAALVTPNLGTPSAGVLTNATGLPVSTGISGLASGVASFLATPSSANLLAAVTDETGTGSLVFATSPTLVTPALGTPTSATLTNATGLPISTGVSGLAAGVASFLATPSSANLRTALTDETGTGSAVFATAPTITSAVLVTPTISGLTLDSINVTNSNISGSTITTSDITADTISDDRGTLQSQFSPLAKAIRVALLASASVRAPQVLDDADIDMGTNNFTVVVRKRFTTTRPAANEILYHKHDGTTGVIVTLLTTGIVRLTLNATTFDSTVALTSASNVEPVIIIPVTRETTTTAGSVTFVVDGVQLGDALVISARVEEIVNGTFASDITGWTITTGSPGSIAWDAAGKLRVTRSGSTLAAYQAVSVAAGETLFVSCAATSVSGASTRPALVLKSDATPSGGTTYTSVALSAAASGTMRVSYYSASAITVYVHLQVGTADGVYDFDTVTSLDTYSVDNASNLYLLGTSTTTTEGSYYDGAIYNRALSVAECLAYCLRGPDFLDTGASQTSAVTGSVLNGTSTRAFSTFSSSADNFTGTTLAGDSSLNYAGYSIAVSPGQKIRVKGSFSITGTLGSAAFRINIATSLSNSAALSDTITVSGTSGDFDVVLTATGSATGIVNFSLGTSPVTDATITVTSIAINRQGITGHWPAFNAQTNTGQIFDQSGNKNHAMLPTSGATILGTPQSMRRQVRWTNTWAATQELQYIGGVNQAILPANAYIESIVGTVSGATPHDIIIGDGSTTNRYVTITTGLATGTTTFTLANRVTDGTNLKLTVDPDTDATMSIAWVITYTLLEG